AVACMAPPVVSTRSGTAGARTSKAGGAARARGSPAYRARRGGGPRSLRSRGTLRILRGPHAGRGCPRLRGRAPARRCLIQGGRAPLVSIASPARADSFRLKAALVGSWRSVLRLVAWRAAREANARALGLCRRSREASRSREGLDLPLDRTPTLAG